MDWSAIGALVGQAAPTLGSILGGFIPFPGGAVLGQVAGKIVAEALGVPPTPEAVHTAITAGDSAVVNAKLSEAEAKMNAEVEKLRLVLLDVQDARATGVEYIKAGSNIAWGPAVMSVLVIIGFVGCLAGLMFIKMNFTETSGQAFLILTGILAQAFSQVCNYWLGSSAGSANKDALLAAAGPVSPVKVAPKK